MPLDLKESISKGAKQILLVTATTTQEKKLHTSGGV